NGDYVISISSTTAELQFSYVGYKVTSVEVSGKAVINVALENLDATLDEVVVVGYGTTKEVNLTGSVSVINSEDISWKPVGQTSMALQGVAPGVTVTQSSGRPGGDAGTIRIRGIGTLGTAGQSPLVLVDGVEMGLKK